MINNKKMTGFNSFSILLIPVVWFFCNAAIAPALGSIAQHFPNASDFELKMVLSITSITSVIFSIVSGKLAKHFAKKYIVMVGLFLYGLGGIFTTFAGSIEQVLILRLLTGVGVGLVLPLPGAIISENYEGERRSRLIGLCTSTANISNVVISVVSGVLLAYGWQYPFYTFAFSFVLVLTTLIGVPKDYPIGNVEDKAEVNSEGTKEKLSGKIYLLALFMIFAWMIHVTLTSNLALFWTREKFGPMTMVGLVLSLSGLASIVVGAIYLQLVNAFNKYLPVVALIAFGAGFGVLYAASSIPSVFIGCILEGIGFGIVMPLIMDATAQNAKDSQKDIAFGIVSGCMHLGGFLSPFIQVVYVSIGNNSSLRFLFLVSAVEIVVAAIIAVLTAVRAKNNMVERI